MKNKIIALLLALTLLSGTCAYAVPLDLWDGDERVTGLFAQETVEIEDFDILQEIIAYIGVADKEKISGESDVKAAVILRALCEIVGFKYDDTVDNATMLTALKSAKFLRSDAKASLLSLQDLLYAAARITGWAEPIDNDGTIYANAKKAGLLTNIAYSTGRNLTKSEAAQLIYNILAVNKKVTSDYTPNYVSLDKEIDKPILQSKYGIVLKEGVVTSLFGETIYSANKIKENEIEIDTKIYKLSDTATTTNLIGRRVAFFVEEENNMVLFAEPTTDNYVHLINYGENPSFGPSLIEYETKTGEEYEIEVDGETIIVYNGLLAGNYTDKLIKNYFSESTSTSITAVDNDDDGVYDFLFVKKWETYVVDAGAGSEGVFTFAYGRKFNGSNSFDATPDDKQIHVTVLKNGEPGDFTQIVDGSLVSISATTNETGHRYITVDAGYETVNGTLNASYGNTYVIDEVEYPVAQEYLDVQANGEVNTPVLGQTGNFYIDITGRVFNADVANEYTYGYLVSISSSRSTIDASYTFKLFTQDGKMEEIPVAKEVKRYTYDYPDGKKMTPEGLANEIVESANDSGDYRRLIQYKLKGGELSDIWYAYDNRTATEFGDTKYQFTYDKHNDSYVFYSNGLITFDSNDSSKGQSYWGKDTILFAIPTDKDAPDGKYEIKSVGYNGSRWTEPTDFYCVDDWNIIEAAVMWMSPEAGIDNYSPVYVVDRVVSAINPQTGEPCYRVYGYDNAVEKSVLVGEEVVSDPGKAGWGYGDIYKITELQFGDLVQFSEVDGMADSFRLVYRHDPAKPDFEMSNTAAGNPSGQIEIKTGTYGGRRNTMFRFLQTIDGVTTGKIMTFSASTSAIIVNLTSGKVTKTSLADVSVDDKLIMHSKWGTMVRCYIYK